MKTTNYQNILFREELERQMDGIGLFDATWAVEFIRNNFAPEDVFTADELLTALIDSFGDHAAFRNEDDMINYVKDMYYPERVFTEQQILDAAESIKEKMK